MKSVLTLSPREAINRALFDCRKQTLKLVREIDRHTLTQQSHPDFSPIGWHLGHIAFTEAYWILEQLAQLPPLYPEYHKLFAADGLSKAERQNLPTLAAIRDYLSVVRSKTLDYLKTAPVETQQRLWWWLIQHEAQHGETIAFVKQLHLRKLQVNTVLEKPQSIVASTQPSMAAIPAGAFMMGNNAIEAQDNERPAYEVYLDTYRIDLHPVTCGQYRKFMLSEGYQNSQYWSPEGWQWQQENAIARPLYWQEENNNLPVYGVSYYEAEAYAKFMGKRLPTEAEWEKAAWFLTRHTSDCSERKYSSSNNYRDVKANSVEEIPSQSDRKDSIMLGNVWEWTSSWFAPYEEFVSYPYRGYSEAYFDGQHKVLRGGSFATNPYALRISFRNWYHPWVRQIFAGFRCVKDRSKNRNLDKKAPLSFKDALEKPGT